MRLPAGERLLSTDGLVVGHEGAAILPPLSMTIAAGELWAVIGANGSGKSTFVRTALGLVPPVAGKVEARPDLRLAYVPQQSALDAIFPISVFDFVLMGLQGPGNVTLLGATARHGARAAAALDEAGARALARRQLRDLSGGQRQRVLIARALATDADLMFLDEPTTALDAAAEHEVLQLIETLRAKRGAAVVMVTHLVEDGLERADRALLLDRDHGVALRRDRGRGARPARVRARLRPLRRPRARRRRDRHRRRPVVAASCGRTWPSSRTRSGSGAWRARCWARSASTSCCAGWCSRRRRSRRPPRWASRCRSGSRRSIDPSGHAAGHAAGPGRAHRPVAAVRAGAVGDRGVAAGDAGVRGEPRPPAPDAREPARVRVPGQRRGRRHRRRQDHPGGA